MRISKIFEDGGIALDSSAFRGTLDLRYGISINFWFILDGSNIFLQFLDSGMLLQLFGLIFISIFNRIIYLFVRYYRDINIMNLFDYL